MTKQTTTWTAVCEWPSGSELVDVSIDGHDASKAIAAVNEKLKDYAPGGKVKAIECHSSPTLQMDGRHMRARRRDRTSHAIAGFHFDLGSAE